MYGVAAASFRVWPAYLWEANFKAAAVILVRLPFYTANSAISAPAKLSILVAC